MLVVISITHHLIYQGGGEPLSPPNLVSSKETVRVVGSCKAGNAIINKFEVVEDLPMIEITGVPIKLPRVPIGGVAGQSFAWAYDIVDHESTWTGHPHSGGCETLYAKIQLTKVTRAHVELEFFRISQQKWGKVTRPINTWYYQEYEVENPLVDQWHDFQQQFPDGSPYQQPFPGWTPEEPPATIKKYKGIGAEAREEPVEYHFMVIVDCTAQNTNGGPDAKVFIEPF